MDRCSAGSRRRAGRALRRVHDRVRRPHARSAHADAVGRERAVQLVHRREPMKPATKTFAGGRRARWARRTAAGDRRASQRRGRPSSWLPPGRGHVDRGDLQPALELGDLGAGLDPQLGVEVGQRSSMRLLRLRAPGRGHSRHHHRPGRPRAPSPGRGHQGQDRHLAYAPVRCGHGPADRRMSSRADAAALAAESDGRGCVMRAGVWQKPGSSR